MSIYGWVLPHRNTLLVMPSAILILMAIIFRFAISIDADLLMRVLLTTSFFCIAFIAALLFGFEANPKL